MPKPQSFVKGDPRINRLGAPKKAWTWRGIIKEIMEEEHSGEETKYLIVKALRNKALKGDVAAAKEIIDRMDGKVKQAVEHSGPEGNALEIIIKKL